VEIREIRVGETGTMTATTSSTASPRTEHAHHARARSLAARIGITVAALVGLLLLYLFFWPVPIQPHRWDPLPDPANLGLYASNRDLAGAESIDLVQPYFGPEDVAIAPPGSPDPGWLVVGVARSDSETEGAILRIDPATGTSKVVTREVGRPLGIDFGASGDLYVADALQGALRFHRDGDRLLRDVIPPPSGGGPILYSDSIRLGPDGRIWFTSPSQRFGLADIRLDGMETQPTGRLLSFDLESRTTIVQLDELMFANGIAHAPDGAFVLVCEWSRYRITRLWLQGPQAGKRDVFYDNLPGYPDNLSWDPVEQVFWVGLVIPRNTTVDRLHPHPFLMKVLPRIPASLQPTLPDIGWLVAIDREGQLVRNLRDPIGDTARVTGARRLGERLILTSDIEPRLRSLSLSALPILEKRELR
jgi:sugar lactone lactonase YvrE